MIPKKPTGWRDGQTIFNFLQWLQNEKGYTPSGQEGRMVDPFHIQDKDWDRLYEEFLSKHTY